MRSAATPLPRADDTTSDRVRVCLLSAGADGISGGHRYHQHLLAAAPRCGIRDVGGAPGNAPDAAAGGCRRHRQPVCLASGRRRATQPSAACRRHRAPAPWRNRRRRLGHAPCVAGSTSPPTGPATSWSRPGQSLRTLLVAEHGLDRAGSRSSSRAATSPRPEHVPALRAGRRLGLLNVANWLPNKGILELLDAVAALPPDDVTLHLVGRTDVEPAYTADVRRRCERPDLVDRVVVHGAARRGRPSPRCTRPPMRSRSRAESRRTAARSARRWRPDCRSSGGAPPTCAAWSTTRSRDCWSHRADRRAHGCDPPPRHRRRRPATLADGARRRGARLPTWRQTTNRFFDALSRLMRRSG